MKYIITRMLPTLALLLSVAFHSAHASDGSEKPAITQTLELEPGWNLVALTVRPADVSMAAVLAPVVDRIVLVRDPDGRTMLPTMEIDEIGLWNVKIAYYLFAREHASLTVTGVPLDEEDLSFDLTSGWNSVPFVGRRPIPVSQMFGEGVVLVRDNQGRSYWPENGIDEIGELVPGEGYQVFASREVSTRLPRTVEMRVFRVPDSIDASGTTDVTGALMAFIESVPNGSTIQFAGMGVYRVEGTLSIRNRRDIIIDGAGAQFVANEAQPMEYAVRNREGDLVRYPWRTRFHWSVQESSDIEVRNLSVRGANENGGQETPAYNIALEAQHAFNITGSTNVIIRDVTASYVYGDFVYVGKSLSHEPSRNIQILNSQFSHNGRQGIAITSAEDVLIDGISMTETRRASIDFEPNSTGDIIRNVVIRNSYFGPGRLLWIAAQGSGGVVDGVLIEDNVLDRTASVHIRPPEGARRSNIRFFRNVSSRPGGGGNRGIWNIWRVDGFEAKDNVAPLGAHRDNSGLWLYDVTAVDAPEGQWPNASPQVYVVPLDGAEGTD